MTTIYMSKRVRMSRMRGSLNRRGMLLMIVLGLLALFAMIGVSFVLITSDADRSAKATLSMTERRQSSTELLSEAAMRVFRGTDAAAWDDRPIGTHNLLTDMYGSPSSRGLTNASGSAFALQVGVVDGDLLLNADSWTNILAKLWAEEQTRLNVMVNNGELTSTLAERYLKEYQATLPYHLAGSYVSLSSGDIYQIVSAEPAGNVPPLKGIYLTSSTRKVLNAGNGMSYQNQTYSIYKPFGGAGLTQATAPFAWTNDGSSDTSQAVAKTAVPFEMLPNMPATAYGTNRAQGGDYNEEYDSPDMQNMFLAYAVMDGNNAQRVVLPSYYRPDLLAYWYRRAMMDSSDVGSNSTANYVPLYYSGTGTWSMEAINWDVINSCVQMLTKNAPNVSSGNSEKWAARVECLEAIRGYNTGVHKETESVEWSHFFAVRRFTEWLSFRPADSTFTGSNPNFRLTYDSTSGRFVTGSWDVDNDGDGSPDSVWVDLGLPTQMGPDGKLVQPLAAVLCMDMDGRLNLNAHGQDTQLATGVQNPNGGPLGRGFGPAEITLSNVVTAEGLSRLLYGDASQGIEGRLGEWNSSITPVRGGTTLAYNASYALANQSVPTVGDGSVVYSNLTAWKQYYPQMLATGVVSGASVWDAYYGLLPDTLGSLYVQTDITGPYGLVQGDMASNFGLAVMRSNPAVLYAANTNYWIDLTTPKRNSSGGKVQIDNPLTAADLERILRTSDADRGTLTARLTTLLGSGDNNATYRQILTTDSYHVPATPAVELPQYTMDGSDVTSATSVEDVDLPSRYGSITEALARYLRIMESQASGNNVYSATVDPYENTVSMDTMIAGEFYQDIPIDPNRRFSDEQYLLDNPGTVIPPVDTIAMGRTERQIMARQLYVLAKFLTRHWKLDLDTTSVDLAKLPGYKKIASVNLPEGKTREDALVSLWLAQWAVNVVDFRDRDSAMTPFWFDPFPDAQTGTNDQLGWTKDKANLICVFGCERPDLLITETLATHARRTEDTTEDATGKLTTVQKDPDNDFDQKRRPIGSLFVEIYNPWGTGEAAPSPELRPSQDWASAEEDVRSVSLNMTNADGDPVWRMGFRKGKSSDESFELDDLLESGNEFERTLYFAEPQSVVTGSTTATDGETMDTLRYLASSSANKDLNNNNMWVRPGQSVVIGPHDAEWKTRTPLSKGNDSEDWFNWDETRYIDLYDTQHGTKTFSVWYNYFGDRSTDASKLYDLNGRDPFNMSNVISIAVDRVDMRETGSTSASWKPTGGENPRFSVSEPRKTDSGYGDFYGVEWGSDPMGSDSSKDYYYTFVLPHPVQRDDKEIQKNGIAGQQHGLNAAMSPEQYNNRLAYLQRLADPRLPYNPNPNDEDLAYNPYITVDKAPIDLVTYNGWNPVNDGDESDELIPDDSRQKMASENKVVFRSRERGYFRQNADENESVWTDIWAQEPILDQIQLGRVGTDAAGKTLRTLAAFNEKQSSPVAEAFADGSGDALSNIQFMPYLSHSLGGVNLCFWGKTNAGGTVGQPTIRPLNLVDGSLATPDKGAFSVLAWNNTPYNSRMELMQVPVTSMSRLLAAPVYHVDVDDADKLPKLLEPGYALVNVDDKSESPKTLTGNGTEIWSYAGYNNKRLTGMSSEDYADGRWYPHLMNFFDSSATHLDTTETETKRISYASNFGQILDFVDTPSAYAGATAWRREPGRVNVNTIPTDTNRNSAVWQALAGTNAASDFEVLDRSRQYLPNLPNSHWLYSTDTTTGMAAFGFDGTVPTIFANPVRAMTTFGAAFNENYDPSVTLSGSDDDDYRNVSPGVLNAAQRSAVVNGGDVYVQPQPAFVGLLRPKSAPDMGTGNHREAQPVLEYHSMNESDQVRSSRFRYEQMQRMANLTTNRSSVYAVWVTLGYFEVTGQNAEGKPTLGEEVESSQGLPNRPRAFYMFDRSIPTGYIPGSDISTDRAVLLRRVINE